MSKAFVSVSRSALVSIAIVLVFTGISARLAYLHLVQSESLLEEAVSYRRRVDILHARRGDIIDSRGNVLAATRPYIVLGVDPQAVKESDYLRIPELAGILGIKESAIRAAFDKKHKPGRAVRWVKLAPKINDVQYERVKQLRVKAVYGNRAYERYYPSDCLASHVIGYVNKEQVASAGVERSLDFYMRGQSGLRETEKDGRRRELAQYRNREISAKDGLNVELSVDVVVQDIVEEELQQVVDKYHPKSASVIVSDVRTGYVLALANYPTYNPNAFWDFDLDKQRNRAVTDYYEPGSTFKIVSASAAIEQGIVVPETPIDCAQSKVVYNGRTVLLPRDDHKMEEIPVSMVVSKSSNRGAVMLGLMLGDKRLYDFCRRFGFGEKTGILLPGEIRGNLPPLKRWQTEQITNKPTISRLPMGHAVGTTPLQTHVAMATLANSGVRMKPQVVRRVYDNSGNTIVSFNPQSVERAVSSETAYELSKMLQDVVSNEGTARRAIIDGYQVAGKTGTTQKLINGVYSSKYHIASFSGFFPASNPEIAITVVVDQAIRPEGGNAYGGVIAAPVFKNIGERLIQYLALELPEESEKQYLAIHP